MTPSVNALLNGAIDYAGLFPPASLPLPEALANFLRYNHAAEAWMLGRFICPVSRLREFSKIAAVMMPGTHATSGYRERADVQEPWQNQTDGSEHFGYSNKS